MDQILGRTDRCRPVLEAFTSAEQAALEADPDVIETLAALGDYSPALTQALATGPEMARRIFLERTFTQPADPEAMARELTARVQNAATLAQVQTALRLFRWEEMARLAARDLTGQADLVEVMATLTNLAELCLQKALDAALRLTAERYGSTPRALGLSPVILGMGKLGGGELNYSSDVDLIYLYRPLDPEPGVPPATTVAQYLFTLVTRAMAELTEDGLVFRVDLDLRPGGKDGAQAQTIETARGHYLALGQPWERMAMLKARPVAGDLNAGRELLAELEPFIFRRHLDYTSIEELKDLKARFTREKKARVSKVAGPGGVRTPTPVLDVKLSPGGIREIEFFAQALTLTFGGRLPHLRLSTTLGALAALADEEIITWDDADDLGQAYAFLRTVEHRLQLKELTQTQTLPRLEAAQEELALSLGFTERPWPDFMTELSHHMAQVGRCFNLLLTEPGERETPETAPFGAEQPEILATCLLDHLDDDQAGLEFFAAAGFRRPETALRACRHLREQRYLPGRLARYSAHLERLLPALVAAMARTMDPDRALLHLDRFMTSIGPKAGFLILLEEHRELIQSLSVLFASSDLLSEILIKHPAILDSFVDRRGALYVKNKKVMASELATMLGSEHDPEICLTVIRRFKNEETLRIGLYDLNGRLSWSQVQAQLSDLAEVVITETMALAEQVLTGRTTPPADIAVMGLGKLGGRELSYGSDLDLVFILAEERPGARVMNEAIRLAQRFISYLSVYLEAGPGYEIDSRLRPSGHHGPLVVTPASFAEYHRQSQLWERQALLKLRPVFGPTDLTFRIKKMAAAAIFERPLPEDAGRQIANLRGRMSRERAKIKPGTINFKFTSGGLVDAEFLTQYLQLIHGRTGHGGLRAVATKTALQSLVRKGLGPPDLARVGPAYELLSRTAGRLGLIYARSGDRAAFTVEEVNAIRQPDRTDSPWEEDRDSVELGTAVSQALALIDAVSREVFSQEERNGQ